MAEGGGSTGVRQIDQQKQVSVVVLAGGDRKPTLVDALARLIDGTSSLIVVDCVELDALHDGDFEAIVDANRALRAARRRLIVINADPEDGARLQQNRVDLGATSDVDFTDDIDGWLDGLDVTE